LKDVHGILTGLQNDVADLQQQIEMQGSTYFATFAKELGGIDDAAQALAVALNGATSGLEGRDGESIPAAVADRPKAHDPSDLGSIVREIGHAVSEAKMSYHNMSLAAKDLVNDADKMDIVVKACQTEFIKLKLMTNNAKARLNAHKLGWGRLGYAFRNWAEYVHYATLECIRVEMDEVEGEAAEWRVESDARLAAAREEFENLLGGSRRTKMELMLRKMKNSRLATGFSTWVEMVMAAKQAREEAERAALLAEYQARFAHLSAAQIEAKLREFIKRWKNQKMIAPFKTWAEYVVEMRRAGDQAALDAELAAMRARLAAMADNEAMQKLKLFFSMKMGKMKSLTFKALVVNKNQEKALKLLESEAGQRLKQFLANKLAGLGRRCWSAWIRHHDNIACENMKNNENARKVAILLEKLARGLVHRIFSAFVRHHALAAEERAAYDAINGRLASLDEMNKAKLRVFLNGKRLGKMSTFFKFWADAWRNRGQWALQGQIDDEDQMMANLQAQIDECEAALAGDAKAAGGLRGQLMKLEELIKVQEAKCADIEYDIRLVNRKVAETEEFVSAERRQRRELDEEVEALQTEQLAIFAERDRLRADLHDIAGDVGHVHTHSKVGFEEDF
jgi:hypothetical protein